MARIFIIFSLLISLTCAGQQAILSAHLLESSYRIVINERSSVRIHGKTNVNKFHCGLVGQIAADTLYINAFDSDKEQVLRKAQLRIAVEDFDCGMRQMTNEMMELLNEPKYPHLSVTVMSLKKKGAIHESLVRFTIAGVSKDYRVPLTAKQSGGWTYAVGLQAINIQDFGLTPPTKFLGAVRVNEIIEVEFNLILKIIEIL
jgi:hypothetical protein